MSISGVGSVNPFASVSLPTGTTTSTQRSGSTQAGQAPPPPPPGGGGGGTPPHVSSAAEALGLSEDDVMEALSNGSSLADLAEEQGVSEDDLVAAIVADMPDDLKSMGNVEDMVGHLVEQNGLGRPTGPPPAGSTGVFGGEMTSDQQNTLSAISDLLGTDSSTLIGVLQNGSSLADLLSDAGVSPAPLAGAVENGLLLDMTA